MHQILEIPGFGIASKLAQVIVLYTVIQQAIMLAKMLTNLCCHWTK